MPRVPVVATLTGEPGDAEVITYLQRKLPHLPADVSHLQKQKKRAATAALFNHQRTESANIHGDLLWLHFFGLGQDEFKNTVLVAGLDLLFVDFLAEAQAAQVFAVTALLADDAVAFLFLGLALGLARQ